MAERPIDPTDVRERVLHELAALPPEQHLEALTAIDQGDVRLDLTDPEVVRVVLGDRWTIELPMRDRHGSG